MLTAEGWNAGLLWLVSQPELRLHAAQQMKCSPCCAVLFWSLSVPDHQNEWRAAGIFCSLDGGVRSESEYKVVVVFKHEKRMWMK